MRSSPVRVDLCLHRRLRWTRLAVSVAAFAVSALGLTAQSVGITTVAGQALSAGSTDNTNGLLARFNNPAGVAADGTNVYIADSANNLVRKLAIATGAVTTMATGFNGPAGVAVDSSGNVYVADTLNHVIRKVTSGGVVSVLAGSTGASGSADLTLANSRFFNPQGVAVNAAGTFVYVADSGNNSVRRIDVSGDAVTTIATGFKPYGMTLNAAGTMLYVADYNGHTIRSINLGSGNALATVAGTINSSGATDSPALFRNPTGVTIDSAGDLYVADFGNNIIRKISGSTVTTIAGSAGLLGTADGVGSSARFQGPFGIVATAVNTFYLSDSNNQTIRRGSPATAPGITSANNTTFTVNQAGSFTVTATGSPAPTFSVVSGALPSFATLNATTGVISGTPTSSAGSPFTFTIQASNGVTPAATQAFTLNVNQAPTITSGNSATFAVGSAGTFTVTATGFPAPTFSIVGGTFPPWASLDATTGALTGTPTNNTGSPFTFTIQASNGVGSAATQNFTLTVNNGAAINSHPANSITLIGQNATFSVGATGTPAPTYQWQRQPAIGGGFSNLPEGGTYTGTTSATLTVNSVSAGMNGDQFQVIVTNGIGSAATSNPATLTAAQVPAITSAASTTFVVNQAGSFTITSTGTPAPTYSVTGGSFPPWASLNSTTGVLTGTPTNTTGSPFIFTITATNGVNPPATQNFTLNVSLADVVAAIATQPVPLTVQLGQNATFTASATGSPLPAVRWQRQPSGTSGFVDISDDGTFSGAGTGVASGNSITSTLTITNVQAGMTGDQFRLVARNTTNNIENIATSSIVTLTVNVGTSISTFVGLPEAAGAVDGAGSAARLNTPTSIAVDVFGNFYVADAANHVIRKITSGGVVSTLAGSAGASGSADGTGAEARFNGPSGVATDNVGNVYVADTYNHTVRVVSASGVVTTLAGSAGSGGSTDGQGNVARFSFPAGIAVDSSANIYVADTNNHTIRRVTLAGQVTTFAGAAGSSGTTNGSGNAARFSYPYGLAIGSGGVIYVADAFNHAIRRVSPTTEVTTIAGTAGSAGSTDANSTSARFNQPNGVAVDSSGNVYVADTFNHTIRKIATNGDVTTLAGTAGLSGSTDGAGAAARFNQPFGLTVDSSGNLYIADTRNHVIRRSGTTSAPGIRTAPQNRVVPVGGSTTFTVVATGVPAPTYQWQRQAAGTVGFLNLTNDIFHSGVTTATMTVSNVLASNSGDQYRVVLANGINPAAFSEPVTLTIGELPVITSAASTSVRATETLSFPVTATGSPTPTFSLTGAPTWLSLNPITGVLGGTAPAGSEGQYTVTISAHNGATVSQTFTLTVQAAVTAPAISSQPGSVAIDQGQTATFSVTASGTAPLLYQWRRDSTAITGATGSTLTIGNVQPGSAGSYNVVVTNAGGTAVSTPAILSVNTPPVLTLQPRAQVALAGSSVTFEVAATGSTGFSYQWRKNGTVIPGAVNPTLTLSSVTAADAGNYDVVVTNPMGTVTSSLAQLTVATAPTAPVVTSRPASRAVLVGGSTTLTVAASGAPTPTYQWRKNGAAIANATGASLTLTNVQTGDAGDYDVVVSNSSGIVTTVPAASVRVITRSYAGVYFGSFSGGVGNFALYVRDDNTGVFLGYLPGSTAPVVNYNVLVSDSGTFSFSQGAIATASVANDGEPPRAAALGIVSVSGAIATDGNLTGTMAGGANASLAGSRAADAGPAQNFTGLYHAGAGTGGGTVSTIAGANGQAFVLVQNGAAWDGGLGGVTSSGQVSMITTRSSVLETITPGSGIVSGSATGVVSASLSGGSETTLARQRLVNISSRARVATGDSVAIAGFVISGEESKPVLIRAVGPTLTTFGVPGALASPRVELFRGSTSLAVNSGIGTNRAAIDAAGAGAGAFALGAAGTDAAILTTLAPGNYTAVVSSSTNTAGVALVEVYDLSAGGAGQKLLNIATRASAGAAENTLIAGFVIPPGSAKRVLIRGVGPGLAAFNISGVLAQPTLTLLNGSTAMATNTNWLTSADSAAITTASAQAGAFGLSTGDSALIVTLAPGNYTAQVTGPGTATGVALIEVYELP